LYQANIFINNSTGTSTDLDGNFIFSGKLIFPVEITVSHIGYKTQTKFFDKTNINEIKFSLKRDFIRMSELVVTGTRTQKLHDNVPIATEVISQDDINNSGAQTIADLLSQRAGVSLQTSVEGGSVLNILGMDSRYILILMDGQPITGRFNNRVALDQILINRVKKVEIVKGPNSSLYGSEAMAGVVNIITKDKNSLETIDVSAQYNNTQNKFENTGIKNGSQILSINGYKPLNKLKIKFNADLNQTNNDKSIQLIEIDKVDKQILGGGIDWELNDNQNIDLNIQIYNQDEIGRSKLMNTDTKIFRNNFSLSYNILTKSNLNVKQSINSNTYSRNYVQIRPWGDLERDDTTNEDYSEYELLVNKIFGSNEITAGYEIYNATYKSDRILSGKQKLRNQSLFAQYDMSFLNQISAIIGLRLDDYSEYSSVLSPRIGFMYRFKENWKFRTSWGQGFRAPSFMERFIDWNHVQFNYIVQGNPDLEPEKSEGINIGIEYVNTSKYQMSLMFYQTKFENLIEDFAIKPGLLSYQNIDKAIFSGLELMCQLRISDQLDSRWGINWINNVDGQNKTIPNTIPLSLTGAANYKHPKKPVNFSINTKWVASYRPQEYDPIKGLYVFAENKLAAYSLIMLKSTIRISNYINLSIGVNNANNYTNDRFGPFVGRSAYIEISSKIKKGNK